MICPFVVLGKATVCNDGAPYLLDEPLYKFKIACPAWVEGDKLIPEGMTYEEALRLDKWDSTEGFCKRLSDY